ncbi:MAG: amine oxidase [Bacteroidota bacterium]
MNTETIFKTNPLFRSFWQAGFECADHLNCHGDRVNILKETFHDVLAEEDYARLIPLNLLTVREGICWNTVEKIPGQYDWSEVINRIEAGKEAGIQQIWDICHFGYPDDLSPFQPRFAERFANICRAFAVLWRSLSDETLIVTPINEISFISWLGGEIKQTVPYTQGLGFEVKRALVKACIAGMEAIWEVDPEARFLHTEPLIYVLPGDDQPQTLAEVAAINEDRFQALDMLAGKLHPELGGKPEYLDIIGLDFYYNNQWIHFGSRVQWEAPQDPRWIPLSQLLKQVYDRYNRPLVLAETSHLGIGRGEWVREIGQECQQALAEGVDLWGVCLYPIIDRPDWDNLSHYHNSGLWDVILKPGFPSERVLCEHYAKDLLMAQLQLSPYIPHRQSIEVSKLA